jgi:hypothetical protein
MSLTSPLTMFLAWLALPGLIVAICAGFGLGVELLSGLRLGALLVPVGFAAVPGLGASLLVLGLSGKLTVVLLVLLALAGPAVALRRGARPRLARAALWPALAALAAYLVAISPLVGSGRTGIVGYVLSDDPAVHLSMVTLLAQHGAHVVPATSSVESVSIQFATGYPLGSFVWPLVALVTTGMDPFFLWTPVIALSAAMTSLAVYAGLRRTGAGAVVAAVAGATVASGYIPFSFLAQGGAKEVELATCVVLAVSAFVAAAAEGLTARRLLPAALAVVGGIGVFGPGALAMTGPAAVAGIAYALWRTSAESRLRTLAASVAAAVAGVLLAAPALIASTRFVTGASGDTQDPNEIGNLVGPVPVRETLNVWLAGDYRFPVPTHVHATDAALVVALAFAIVGIVWSIAARRPFAALLLAGAAVASGYSASRYSVYFTAKTYVTLAVAVGVASATGVVALMRIPRLRTVAIVLGALLVCGVGLSDVIAYRDVWMTPKGRFQELISIDHRYAGRGPTLVVEREDYARHLLRDLEPWESYGPWQPTRGLLAGIPSPFHTPDMDDYDNQFMHQFRLIVALRRPGASAPPTGFRLLEETPHYLVWSRTGPGPREHVGLARGEAESDGPLECTRPDVAALLRTARADHSPVRIRLVAPHVVSISPRRWEWFAGFAYGPTPDYVATRDAIAVIRPRLRRGRYVVWLRGQVGVGFRISVLTRKVGDVFGDLGQLDQWLRAGEIDVRRDEQVPVMLRKLGKPVWEAGSARGSLIGAMAFERLGVRARIVTVSARRAHRFCGRSADWIELP